MLLPRVKRRRDIMANTFFQSDGRGTTTGAGRPSDMAAPVRSPAGHRARAASRWLFHPRKHALDSVCIRTVIFLSRYSWHGDIMHHSIHLRGTSRVAFSFLQNFTASRRIERIMPLLVYHSALRTNRKSTHQYTSSFILSNIRTLFLNNSKRPR